MSESTSIQQQIDTIEAERESAKGAVKGRLTKQLKALRAELEAAQAPVEIKRVKLEVVEAEVIATLKGEGVTEPTQDQIAAAGDPYFNEGLVIGYTAAKYGNGAWVSQRIVRRVSRAVKQAETEAEAEAVAA